MTGEITLRGRVLPIGGLKSKLLAAHLAGVKTVLIPKRNEKDLVDVPEEVRTELRIVPVETMDQVLAEALIDACPAGQPGSRRSAPRARSGSRRDAGAKPRATASAPSPPGDSRAAGRAATGGARLIGLPPTRADAPMEYKDYYAVLGVPEDGDPGRDQEGLPQAGARAPPGPQPR